VILVFKTCAKEENRLVIKGWGN